MSSVDVIFNEEDFSCKKVAEGPHQKCVEFDNGSEEDVESRDSELDLGQEEECRRYPEWQRLPPTRFGIDEYADTVTTECTDQITEPSTIQEASENREWKRAADTEYQSLMENETWELVKLPSNQKSIGCKWVFKAKRGEDSKVERLKARLVAKGCSQTYGENYDETFSPVVRFSSIRTLLAFAIQIDMLIHQMDVVTAFLNGKLKEEICMQQPPGYVEQGKEHLVCKLKKSLYGLKQSPRCWNTAFREYMESIHYKQSAADPCVFIKAEKEGITIVAVYVDDLIIFAKTAEKMDEVKKNLATKFKMKDLGKLHYCLGITIEQDKKNMCLCLHQKQYIQEMIERYGLSEAKTVATPADVNVKLKKIYGVSKTVDSSWYQSMVGSLLYACNATRPDIAQAVGVVSKFSSNPNEAHLTAVKRIMRYLKGTINIALYYKKTEDKALIGYSDADWAGDQDDRHSTTGNLFLMSGGTISWLSKKQPGVTLSTAEAEYVALSTATQEAVWLRRMLAELQVKPGDPTVIMEDNTGAIAIAKNPVSHSRTKHIDIRYHYVREAVQDNLINLRYCPTEEMTADVLTKSLPRERFEKLRKNMGLDSVHPAQSVN